MTTRQRIAALVVFGDWGAAAKAVLRLLLIPPEASCAPAGAESRLSVAFRALRGNVVCLSGHVVICCLIAVSMARRAVSKTPG